MKFFNRFAVSLLASVLCASTLFAMPVDAKKTTKRRQPTQAELAAAAALQAAIDERYNKEIESNSWENWPAGPQVYAESWKHPPERSCIPKPLMNNITRQVSPRS